MVLVVAGLHLGVKLLGHMTVQCSTFDFQTVSEMTTPYYIAAGHVRVLQFLHGLADIVVARPPGSSHPSGCEVEGWGHPQGDACD